jgi:hypothetical protein
MATVEPPYPAVDEFETDVLPVRRRPRLPLVTTLLAVAAIAAAGVIGGVEIQKHFGAAPASSAAGGAGFAGFARGGGAPGGGFGGGGFGGGGAGAPAGASAGGATSTTGLVTLIKGSTLYVTDFSGNTIKVQTTKGLKVTKTVTSSVKTVHPGDSVTVVATKQKNGSYVASSVSVG